MATTARQLDPQAPQQGLPLKVEFWPVVQLKDDEFFQFCQINRDLRIERNSQGEILLMPPTGADSGRRNAEITIQLGNWAKRDGTGLSFDSSTGFILSNGAVRSPDASWVKRSRLDELTAEQMNRFLPLCPDFVLELHSPSDQLAVLQAKMLEYLDNGAQLGWLIEPGAKRVYVYRPETAVNCLEGVDSISGDPVLAGFVLELVEVW